MRAKAGLGVIELVDGGDVMPWWVVWLLCNVAFLAGAWWASRDRV